MTGKPLLPMTDDERFELPVATPATAECTVCGAPWVRPVCAPWCERVATWLRDEDAPPGVRGGLTRWYGAKEAEAIIVARRRGAAA